MEIWHDGGSTSKTESIWKYDMMEAARQINEEINNFVISGVGLTAWPYGKKIKLIILHTRISHINKYN